MRTKEELPACPVATTVSHIGSKWKLLIMRNPNTVGRERRSLCLMVGYRRFAPA